MVHLSLEFNRCLQDANNWLGGQSNIPNTIRTKRDALGAWYEYQKTYINPDKFAHKTADDFSLACIQLNNAKSGLLEIITNDKLSEALSYPFWDSLVSLDEFEHCNTMRPYRNLLGKLEHVDGVWYGIGPRGFNTPVQLHSGSWL